ncbi:MAG: hypothetical protein NZO58_12905 [Gemmataceae bacterium]|nr:hypothetical protein [Gemmataceae bacterium]
MSRETKIGLIVAVSFVCLVGVVVASRWRRGVDATQMVEIKPKDPVPAAVNDNPPPARSDKKEAVVQAAAVDNVSPPRTLANVGSDNAPPLIAIPPPGGQSNDPSVPPLPMLPPAPSSNEPSLPNLPPLPSGNLPPPPGGPMPPPPATGTNLAGLAAPPGSNSPPPPRSGVTVPLPSGNDTPALPPLPLSNDDQLRAQLQALKKEQEKSPLPANVPSLPPLPEPSVKSNDLPVKIGRGPEESQKTLVAVGNNPPPPKDNNLPLPPPPVLGNTPAQAKDTNPPAPPPNNTSLPPIPAPKPSDSPFPSVPGLANNPSSPGNVAPHSGVPMPSLPAPASAPGVSTPSANLKAGNNPSFTIPAPGSGVASVAVHDLQYHTVRGNETFAGLSKTYYGSEKYADALLTFNRDYAGNRNLTTVLQPGQQIMIPSAEFLRNRYSAMISDLRPGTGGVGVSIGAPSGAGKPSFAPTTPSPDATKSYRVAAEGQMIWQVAVQTLGDGNRWPEILRLNPGLQTLQPIPGGTILRLPSNANVP